MAVIWEIDKNWLLVQETFFNIQYLTMNINSKNFKAGSVMPSSGILYGWLKGKIKKYKVPIKLRHIAKKSKCKNNRILLRLHT